MPTATTISINDATPTAHAYVPTSVTPQLSIFRNVADAAISASEEQIGLSLSRANSQRTTNKVKVTLAVPYEQTVDSVVSVRSTARMTCDIVLPDDMSATERGHFAALVANLIADADVQDYITDLEPYW